VNEDIQYPLGLYFLNNYLIIIVLLHLTFYGKYFDVCTAYLVQFIMHIYIYIYVCVCVCACVCVCVREREREGGAVA